MVSRIRSWNTSAASNNQTPPFGAPEGGTFVNQLTDILRQVMAEVRAWWETPGWIDYGQTPTFVNTTSFTVGGNQTSIYQVGRRIRATNSVAAEVYGTIATSVFTTNTAVSVTWDSAAMDSSLTEIAVGAANVLQKWIGSKAISGLGTLAEKSTVATADISNLAVTEAKLANLAVTFAKLATTSLATASAQFTAAGTSLVGTAAGIFDYVTSYVPSYVSTYINGQTWQNVIGSRAIGTTYTNSTGRPITVSINIFMTNTAVRVELLVGGLNVQTLAAATWMTQSRFCFTTVVPNGSTYQVSVPIGSAAVEGWAELR